MKTVRLITCNNAMQAHILQGALENEGIESILHNENFSSLYSGCINNISGVDIFVSEKDHAKAVEILKDNGSWPEDLILCPYCHSTSIQLVLKKGYKLRALGAAFLSALSTLLRAIIIGNIYVNDVKTDLISLYLHKQS